MEAAKISDDSGKVLEIETPSSSPIGARTVLHPTLTGLGTISGRTMCCLHQMTQAQAWHEPLATAGSRMRTRMGGERSSGLFCGASAVNSQIYATRDVNLKGISLV